jgi:hypothetical protein
MALEDFKAGLEQTLELGIAGGRNKRRSERAIDRLVIRNLVSDVCLVALTFRTAGFPRYG